MGLYTVELARSPSVDGQRDYRIALNVKLYDSASADATPENQGTRVFYLSCDCPAWTNSNSNYRRELWQRSCKHTRSLTARLLFMNWMTTPSARAHAVFDLTLRTPGFLNFWFGGEQLSNDVIREVFDPRARALAQERQPEPAKSKSASKPEPASEPPQVVDSETRARFSALELDD